MSNYQKAKKNNEKKRKKKGKITVIFISYAICTSAYVIVRSKIYMTKERRNINQIFNSLLI